MATKERVPAIDGWFSVDGEPRLQGSKCPACGTVFFPGTPARAATPTATATSSRTPRSSRTGTVWSYTDARYKPPPPFVPPSDPFAPFAIAAVELAEEQLVVLGQVVAGVGVGDLRIGMEVELVVEPLFEDDERVHLVWKWKPRG